MFDVGIVRCVGMYAKNGMFKGRPKYNFVMGVESGMPADPDLLPILQKLTIAGAPWQVTAIGRAEIWPLHRRAAELGGHLRTGLEDTFYLPDGSKTGSNGALVDMLARYARDAGRAVASPPRRAASWGLRPRELCRLAARNCSRSDAARGGTICDGMNSGMRSWARNPQLIPAHASALRDDHFRKSRMLSAISRACVS